MQTYHYFLTFSPYMNILKAKNKKDAWKKLRKMWPEYDVRKVVTLS